MSFSAWIPAFAGMTKLRKNNGNERKNGGGENDDNAYNMMGVCAKIMKACADLTKSTF